MGMTNVMVDIETTGTDPYHTGVIQIAAVRFDIENKAIDATNMFDRCLALPPTRFWDESTREWWLDQGDILPTIMNRMEPPETVMKAFFDWSLEFPGCRFWAKPVTFDYVFMASYFKSFGLENPYHFRYATDLNSYLYGKGHTDTSAYWKTVEPVGDAHNALHDVLYQIRGVFNA